MKVFGWILFAAGLALLAWAFVYDPSVSSAGALYDRTVNLGLLAEKLMLAQIGGSLLVAGSVLAVGASLLEKSAGVEPTAGRADKPAGPDDYGQI